MTQAPNLLFFLSDNHNRDVLGCYGHGIVRTPTLDGLAARGARFENAYCSSSLCVPSRASIATGRFPHQTGYWDNVIAYDGRVPSWMHRLRDAGYDTVSIGKLHYRSTEDDNGFAEEIVPLHIVDGVGGLVGLLRWNEPPKTGFFDLYDKRSGVGETEYQDYDRKITAEAVILRS
jgi:choline-sulfatase